MHIALSYPPIAYPMMPYLAPFLLKGWLEAETAHTASVHDLNIEFHHFLWRGSFAETALETLVNSGRKKQALLAELLGAHGEKSWLSMQNIDNHKNPEKLWPHANLLKNASRLVSEIDSLNGVYNALPFQKGMWRDTLDQYEFSVVGQFLQRKIMEGLFDDIQIVGMSVAYVEQLLPALLQSRLLKQRNPALRIVLGGSGATHFLEELTHDLSVWEYIDYFIPFEGEVELSRLLDLLEDEKPVSSLNIAQCVNNKIVYKKELKNRPNAQATPDFSELKPLYPTPEPIYPLLTSKGCYWGKCAFCTHHEGYGQGFYRFDNEKLAAMIEKMIADGARAFYFVDEALPPATLVKIAETFLEVQRTTGISNVRWMAEARIERKLAIYPEPELLYRAGCRVLVNGIESGSQAVIDNMRKGIDLKAAQKHLKDSEKHGIKTGWMFFVGFPGESDDQSEDTFRFIQENRNELSFASIGVFQLEKGSPIWNKPQLWGVLEVIGKDQAYATDFAYRMENGELINKSILKERLADLHTKYPDLKPLFGAAVDRASSLFLGSTQGDDEVPLSWDSVLANGKAELHRKEKEIRISPLQNV